jgi:hypothetical protein
MSGNVVQLENYREPVPDDLASMPYGDVVTWAGGDFRRLLAVAKARDYRPEWIAHQIENYGMQLSEKEAEVIAGMVAEAGPFLSRRRRWILRQLRVKTLTQHTLTTMASSAAEYRDYKDIPRCVDHDIDSLFSLGMIREGNGKLHPTDQVNAPLSLERR